MQLEGKIEKMKKDPPSFVYNTLGKKMLSNLVWKVKKTNLTSRGPARKNKK